VLIDRSLSSNAWPKEVLLGVADYLTYGE
jgi:hypothetical protein